MKPLKTRHAASREKQKTIIQAALRCFAEKGYSETRISDICQLCNANTGSIYHHFTSKEGLAAQVYLAGIRDYQEGLVAVLSQEISAREGIHALVAFHLKWVDTHPDWARFLIQKRHAEFMGPAAEEFKEMNKAFMTACTDWFKQHIDAGSLRVLPQELFISILLGPCQEYARLLVSEAVEGPDIERGATVLGDAAWRCLRADPSS